MQGCAPYPQISLHGTVVGGRLTKSGCPLLFLVDGSARVLHMGLKEWLTVSNPQFSVSPYASQLAMSGNTLGLTQHTVSLFSHALLDHRSQKLSLQRPSTALSSMAASFPTAHPIGLVIARMYHIFCARH